MAYTYWRSYLFTIIPALSGLKFSWPKWHTIFIGYFSTIVDYSGEDLITNKGRPEYAFVFSGLQPNKLVSVIIKFMWKTLAYKARRRITAIFNLPAGILFMVAGWYVSDHLV